MATFVFVGADSTVFAQRLLGDILGCPELAGSAITLLDLDPVRLATSAAVARKVAATLGARPTEAMRAAFEGDAPIAADRSAEYGAQIIHSIETGTPRVVSGNVANHGLIANLPAACCAEVPCVVDRNGVQPVRVGALPPHLAALMQTIINVRSPTVEAALTHKRAHIYRAAMLDPRAAAALDLDQIWAVVDDLITAHGDWLPTYAGHTRTAVSAG